MNVDMASHLEIELPARNPPPVDCHLTPTAFLQLFAFDLGLLVDGVLTGKGLLLRGLGKAAGHEEKYRADCKVIPFTSPERVAVLFMESVCGWLVETSAVGWWNRCYT